MMLDALSHTLFTFSLKYSVKRTVTSGIGGGLDTSNNHLTEVLLLCCESHGSSQREWPCCLRCHDTSNNLTVVLLLYFIALHCESNSSSQRKWPCGSSPQETSNTLTVVLLLYSSSRPARVAVLFEM